MMTNKQTTIPIVLNVDDFYVPYLSITIYSIIKNSSSKNFYAFYILSKEIDPQIKKTVDFLKRENVSITWININQYIQDVDLASKRNLCDFKYISQVTFYRLWISHVLTKYEKVIYLDSDVIVQTDIANLFQIDIKNNLIAGARDAIQKMMINYVVSLNLDVFEYVNAGVLIINLKKWKEENIFDKFLDLLNQKIFKYQDQDILNIACKNKIYILPPHWNYIINNNDVESYRSIFETDINFPKNIHIIHYSWKEKPWNNPEIRLAYIWWKYAKETPLYELIVTRNFFSNKNCTSSYLTNNTSSLKLKRKKFFKYPFFFRKKILIIEINDSHAECLPGAVKYFLDLNYEIDLLISEFCYNEKVFLSFNTSHINPKTTTIDDIKKILSSPLMERYSIILFNSDRIYSLISNNDTLKWPFVLDYFSNYISKKLYSKIIVLCHHEETFLKKDDYGVKFISLIDRSHLGYRYSFVNFHYFYPVHKHLKNKITSFIIVGRIEDSRKNFSGLIKAIYYLVSNSITSFKVTIVGRVGSLEIPSDLKTFIDFKGYLTFPELLKLLKTSDFLITLLDPDNLKHNRYLRDASGSYQLSYGCNLPCLLPISFMGKNNFFNLSNSVGYNSISDLPFVLEKCIKMPQKKYKNLWKKLSKTEKYISKISIKNLYYNILH